MYGIVTNLKFGEKSFKLIINDLHKSDYGNSNKNQSFKNPLEFKNSIKFKDISFGYGNKKNLSNLNFEIKKNQINGLVGSSGKGKSTVSYILMGLIKPDEGEIIIDEKNIKENLDEYQKMISYLPQEITLEDITLKENIISDVNQEIDMEKLMKIFNKVQLKKFTDDKSLNRLVGEKGLKLSGGERQRLLLARALYRDPEILVLDEFTSNLDEITEKELLKTLIDLKKRKDNCGNFSFKQC